MSRLNSHLIEKSYCDNKLDFLFNENLNFNSMNKVSKVETLLNNLQKSSDDEKVIDLLNFLNYIVNTLSSDEFDQICIKYLNKLNDLYKESMNKIKVAKEENALNTILSIIDIINKSLANLFQFFHKNFQNYNEKHKNMIKLIPNGLKIYFKLFEDTFINDSDNKIPFNKLLIIFQSFSINVIVMINNFPTMIRTFESKLNNIYKHVMTELITSDFINHAKLTNVVCLTYTMLVRLSPDFSTNFNKFLNKLIKNVKYYKTLSEPKTIKTIKVNSKTNQEQMSEKEDIFKFKENITAKLKTPSILMCNNIMHLLIIITKLSFKSIPKNSVVEINFNNLVLLLIENLEGVVDNKELITISETDYIVEGLQLDDYKLFQENFLIQNFKIFRFLIKNYSEYMYYFIPSIKSFLVKIIMNFEKTYSKFYENYLEVFKFVNCLFLYFDSRLLATLQEFVQKILVNNFIEIYVSYLERNDKTVVKVDNKFFKLGKVKSNLNQGNKKKSGVSLIQMARQETFNEKLENYSSLEIEGILNSYLKVFVTFFQSDSFKLVLLNIEHRSLLKTLLEMLVLPPYAKFIFNISDKVKENIGDFIYYYLKNSNNSLDCSVEYYNYDKLNSFLRAFYSSGDTNKIFGIFEKLNKKKKISRKEDTVDITSNFVDINKKIADKLKSNLDKINKIIEREDKISDTPNTNGYSDIQVDKKINISDEDNTTFKIEYSLNLIDEDNEKNNSKSIKSSREISHKKNQEDEFSDYLSAKKKPKVDTADIAIENKDEVLNANVNKIFKSKWSQVKSSEIEFTSKDGIYVMIKNKEDFTEDQVENCKKPSDPIQAKISMPKQMVVDDEMDSDSDIEIPDII